MVFDVFLSKNNLGLQSYSFLFTYANLNMKLFIFQNYGTFIRRKGKSPTRLRMEERRGKRHFRSAKLGGYKKRKCRVRWKEEEGR